MKIYLPLLVAGAAISIQASAATTSPTTITTTTTTAVAPAPTDARILWTVNPRNTLASNYWTTGWNGDNTNRGSLQSLPEPGYLDTNVSQFTVMRGPDPVDPAKKAFRHKIIKGMKYRTDADHYTARGEIAASWNKPINPQLHQKYWAVFAFYIDNDHPFDKTGGDLDLVELGHPVTSANNNPSPVFDLFRDGTWAAYLGSNPVLDGTASTKVYGSVFREPIKKGVWHYIIVQFKLEWDVAQGPYFRVWRATGSGAPVQLCNTNRANIYRESVTYTPQKFGLYAWDVTDGPNGIWGSSPSRTIYTKGVHIFRDQPGTPTLNLDSLLAFIRSM